MPKRPSNAEGYRGFLRSGGGLLVEGKHLLKKRRIGQGLKKGGRGGRVGGVALPTVKYSKKGRGRATSLLLIRRDSPSEDLPNQKY